MAGTRLDGIFDVWGKASCSKLSWMLGSSHRTSTMVTDCGDSRWDLLTLSLLRSLSVGEDQTSPGVWWHLGWSDRTEDKAEQSRAEGWRLRSRQYTAVPTYSVCLCWMVAPDRRCQAGSSSSRYEVRSNDMKHYLPELNQSVTLLFTVVH